MTEVVARHVRRLGRAAATVAIVAWLAFAAIVIVLRYVVLPNVGAYRADFERLASTATGATVTIGAVEASWRGLRPSLVIRDVRVVDAHGSEALVVPSGEATLSWETLAVLQPRFAALELVRPSLSVVRERDGQFVVAGYRLKKKVAPDDRAAEWLLAQDALRVHGATVTWHDETADDDAPGSIRPDLVLTDVTAALERSGWRHRFALRATPPTSLAAPFDVRGVVDHPFLATKLADPAAWRGELYADVASGDITAWKTWVPLPTTFDGGRGRARVWATFTDADQPAGVFARRLAARIDRPIPPALDRIESVTADLALDDIAVRWGAMRDAPEYAAIASIDGRVAASQSPTEQRATATHMALQPRNGPRVAPTDFEMSRTVGAAPDDEAGTASLGAIDIAVSLGLVPAPLVPPAVADRLAALKPHGTLEHVALRWTGPIVKPATFTAEVRFAGLGIAAQAPTPEAIAAAARETVGANGLVRRPRPAFGEPGFDRLGGTLVATRTKDADGESSTHATAKLAGTDVSVTTPGLFDEPTLRLAHVAADVAVTTRGTDLEVKVEHATLDNADLAAEVGVVFRKGPKSGGIVAADGSAGRGWLDVDARLSRADVARVPRYLPNIIGERARVYLHRSLLGGKVVDATLRLRGPLEHLSLRDQPDALAVPNPTDVRNALVAIRDGRAERRLPTVAPRVAGPDDAVFHALVHVRDATFLYGPGRRPGDPPPVYGPPSPTSFIPWPAFEDVDAEIEFDHARMTVRARRARVFDYRLTDIVAELPALADPAHVLRVVGHGTGPLQDLVHFVNESPISRWLRRFTDNTKATGNAALALALDLPLTHPRDTELAASLQFDDDGLAINAAVPPLTHIAGRMDFSDRGLAIDGLRAEAFGGPLAIAATTTKDGYIELKANGTIDVARLRRETTGDESTSASAGIVERATRVLSGRTAYDVAMRVHSKRITDLSSDPAAAAAAARSTQPDLVVHSDLEGLAIALPAPFDKPAAAAWPLRIELARRVSGAVSEVAGAPQTPPDTEDLHASLADRVDVRVTRRRNGDEPFVATAAAYRVGPGPAPADDGTGVTIDVASLDVDAWRDAFRELVARPAGATDVPVEPATSASLDAWVPTHATLRTPSLKAFDRTFDQVAVTARRLQAGWQADITADQVAGRVSYDDVSGTTATRNGVAPVASARLVARLDHLSIPASDPGTAHVGRALDASRQRDFPAIDVVVDRFDLRGRTLGRLEVLAENVAADGTDGGREWRLERVGLTTPEARFVGRGVWGHAGTAADGAAPEHTSLDFDLQASNVGALLDRFGMTRTIADGTASLSGHASWDGGPSTIDYESMNGTLRLAADRGRFLKAEPGVAKLLNIISLQGLARRLTLDFTDVFSPGFAFDSVRADATVDHGIASTDDFTMKGVEAVVTMAGSADLARETTALHVRVEPQINAGAASLGVAVINPVVGLATFAAQYFFKDRISQALAFEYNVNGPWSHPAVTKIDRHGNETPVVPKKTVATETPSTQP